MRLKRGVERESCDFCHKRKIKCDRACGGSDTCSACERRDIACMVDDSNDIRLRRRRPVKQGKIQPETKRIKRSLGLASSSRDAADSFTTIQDTLLDTLPDTLSDTLPDTLPDTLSDALPDNPFHLNPDSILFLDQVFMGDVASDWMDISQAGLFIDPPALDTQQPPPEQVPSMDHYQDIWNECAVSSHVFMAALHACFAYAALCLPVVFEDAFWKDVQAGIASSALVCAVACRGMPFSQHAEKWALQQCLAGHFKRLFLQQQQNGNQKARLDDIEALALMVGFPYEEGAVNGLERLFLSHDALVLMTLQLSSSKDVSTLSRAAERHSLLFWHVYGLDAFTSLDKKTASRIPETQPTPGMTDTGSGYLDAVLSLALVARRILQKLCGAQRLGIKYADVAPLYDKLQAWRDSSCPHRLRYRPAETEAATDPHLHLQRAVLHLLHINCYMQIESWVDEHGVCLETLADEMTAPRVEYESLRVLHEGVGAARWLKGCHAGEFALADLAPSILRDICAGLCVWTCLRGRRVRDAPLYRTITTRTDSVQMYLEATAVLRSAAATAISHCDTAALLAKLDGLIAPLQEPEHLSDN